MKMANNVIFCAGATPACRFARTYLKDAGLPVTDVLQPDIGHLLLDVPSFGPDGNLRSGGSIKDLLTDNVIVYGGNLEHPELQNHTVVDFLKDDVYLAQNARITAEAALDVALPCLSVTLRECPVLIIGWGRIGKCLSQLLRSIGADVAVAARKESDRAILSALGYRALDIDGLVQNLAPFRLVYNTVPHPVLSREQTLYCREDCVLIDLASRQGIDHENVIIARGLPGIHFPESSGKLIAQTFLKYYHKEV